MRFLSGHESVPECLEPRAYHMRRISLAQAPSGDCERLFVPAWALAIRGPQGGPVTCCSCGPPLGESLLPLRPGQLSSAPLYRPAPALVPESCAAGQFAGSPFATESRCRASADQIRYETGHGGRHSITSRSPRSTVCFNAVPLAAALLRAGCLGHWRPRASERTGHILLLMRCPSADHYQSCDSSSSRQCRCTGLPLSFPCCAPQCDSQSSDCIWNPVAVALATLCIAPNLLRTGLIPCKSLSA